MLVVLTISSSAPSPLCSTTNAPLLSLGLTGITTAEAPTANHSKMVLSTLEGLAADKGRMLLMRLST